MFLGFRQDCIMNAYNIKEGLWVVNRSRPTGTENATGGCCADVTEARREAVSGGEQKKGDGSREPPPS
jgi:hypothetical protein